MRHLLIVLALVVAGAAVPAGWQAAGTSLTGTWKATGTGSNTVVSDGAPTGANS